MCRGIAHQRKGPGGGSEGVNVNIGGKHIFVSDSVPIGGDAGTALHLENLGGESGGTPEQIAQQMMQGVTDMVVREVATAGVNSLIDRHLDGGAADAAKGAVKKFMEFKGD